MPTNLFVYGTLEDPDCVEALTGRRFGRLPASLPNYVCRRLSGERYPGVVWKRGELTRGTLLVQVDARSLRRLVRYEGSAYRLKRVHVRGADGRSVHARCFVLCREARRRIGRSAWQRFGPSPVTTRSTGYRHRRKDFPY